MADQPQQVQINVQWMSNPTAVPTIVNQIALQSGMGGEGGADVYYLNLGHVTPPIVVGQLDAAAMQQLQSTAMPIVPVGSFALTTNTVRDLHRILGEVLGSLQIEA